MAKTRVYKDEPSTARRPSQARAHLAVKTGGFSIGAFASSNRGKVNDHYQVEKKILGEGSYGSVQRCQFKDTGQWRALKTINKALVKNPEQFKEEMAIMRLLDHPNIVRLFESFEDDKHVYLVLELCTGGELFERIVAEDKFTESAAATCVLQMLRAVNYMHMNYIMHRDLKPENWLLTSTEPDIEQADLKLIDFGLSKRFVPGEFATTKAGTPYYVAPEVLEGRYAESSDVWSIGVIMYILLCGSPPFSGSNTVAVLESVKRAQPTFEEAAWGKVSPQARQMLEALLEKSPLMRMSASLALQQPWLRRARTSGGEPLGVDNSLLSNLRCFSSMNKLKKASMNVIASQLSNPSVKDLKDVFMAMDENNDGTLSVSELKEGMRRAGLDLPPDFKQVLASIDTDGSGVIDYSEFMAATMDKCHLEEDACWHAFKTFDVDGNGTIDKDEIMKLLGVNTITSMMDLRLTQREVETIIKEVDLDGDGKIDFAEFLTMMRKVPKGIRGLAKTKTPPSRRQSLVNIGIGSSLQLPDPS